MCYLCSQWHLGVELCIQSGNPHIQDKPNANCVQFSLKFEVPAKETKQCYGVSLAYITLMVENTEIQVEYYHGCT